jgi:hypothetical protein
MEPILHSVFVANSIFVLIFFEILKYLCIYALGVKINFLWIFLLI